MSFTDSTQYFTNFCHGEVFKLPFALKMHPSSKQFCLAVGEKLCCGGKKEISAQFYLDLEETNLFYVVGVAEMVLAQGIEAAVT